MSDDIPNRVYELERTQTEHGDTLIRHAELIREGQNRQDSLELLIARMEDREQRRDTKSDARYLSVNEKLDGIAQTQEVMAEVAKSVPQGTVESWKAESRSSDRIIKVLLVGCTVLASLLGVAIFVINKTHGA